MLSSIHIMPLNLLAVLCAIHKDFLGVAQMSNVRIGLNGSLLFGNRCRELGAFVGASRRSLALFERSELATDDW